MVRQISNRDTEVEFLSVDLLSSQVHAVSVILPAIESESELDVPQLAEAEGMESTSSRDCRHRILLDMMHEILNESGDCDCLPIGIKSERLPKAETFMAKREERKYY
jgi:hypothetical protein